MDSCISMRLEDVLGVSCAVAAKMKTDVCCSHLQVKMVGESLTDGAANVTLTNMIRFGAA